MGSFSEAVSVLQMLVVSTGACFSVWGALNLIESLGTNNKDDKRQGRRQLVTGGAMVFAGVVLVPLLPNLLR